MITPIDAGRQPRPPSTTPARPTWAHLVALEPRLADLLAEAERRGARRVLLEVATTNPVAQRLYASAGFDPVGVRRGYYQPSNTDALVMRRDG